MSTVYLKRMKRRDFLKTFALGIIGLGIVPEIVAQGVETPYVVPSKNFDGHIKDYLHKMKHFNVPHKDDVKIDILDYKTFESIVMRLRRLQQYVGHGNYQLLSFDVGLRIARNYSQIGEFSRAEIKFLEIVFYSEAKRYGFFGQKPLTKLSSRINKNEVVKIPYTGNYLYKGLSFETFNRIKQQIGEEVVLTSGVRGVMKQFLLFLNSVYKHNGNFSLASRSLAPPGYSFHGIGDFDVGQVGLGVLNFTERFTTSEVFSRLNDLGYLKLRYSQKNMLGVRYEPWHIQIAT